MKLHSFHRGRQAQIETPRVSSRSKTNNNKSTQRSIWLCAYTHTQTITRLFNDQMNYLNISRLWGAYNKAGVHVTLPQVSDTLTASPPAHMTDNSTQTCTSRCMLPQMHLCYRLYNANTDRHYRSAPLHSIILAKRKRRQRFKSFIVVWVSAQNNHRLLDWIT